MDPITLFVIICAAVLIGPTVFPLILGGIASLTVKGIDKYDDRKKVKRRTDPKYQKKAEQREEIYKSLIRDNNMEFTNMRTSAKKLFNITEIINFDQNKDKLFHGKLTITRIDGTQTVDDIYLFQPRVYARQTLLGPNYSKDGKLLDKFGYTARIPGSDDIYYGYTPKREFMTGRQFDYVSDSVNKNNEMIRNFINITIPRDENGNFIPVDLSNKQELDSLREYVIARTQYGLDPDQFLEDRLDWAEEAYEEWKVATRPRYAEPIRQVSESELKRVEKARQSKEYRDRMQQRYNYWLAVRPPEGPMGAPMMPMGGPMPPNMPYTGMHPGPMPPGMMPPAMPPVNVEPPKGPRR